MNAATEAPTATVSTTATSHAAGAAAPSSKRHNRRSRVPALRLGPGWRSQAAKVAGGGGVGGALALAARGHSGAIAAAFALLMAVSAGWRAATGP